MVIRIPSTTTPKARAILTAGRATLDVDSGGSPPTPDMRRLVGIIGFSRSGKTTLAVALVRHFAGRGERVAYVKHTHHAVGELAHGGDTRLALDAGAALVVIADEEDAVRWDRAGNREGPLPYESPSSLVSSVDAERVIVEGWKDTRLWPVILVEREGADSLRPATGIAAVVSSSPTALPVPHFAPDDLAAIAAFVDKIAGS
ncbi:MAG: molybdopterin-guanine dinucleotide biosynthesis protein MobB [Thermoanaerobaculia bacterium]